MLILREILTRRRLNQVTARSTSSAREIGADMEYSTAAANELLQWGEEVIDVAKREARTYLSPMSGKTEKALTAAVNAVRVLRAEADRVNLLAGYTATAERARTALATGSISIVDLLEMRNIAPELRDHPAFPRDQHAILLSQLDDLLDAAAAEESLFKAEHTRLASALIAVLTVRRASEQARRVTVRARYDANLLAIQEIEAQEKWARIAAIDVRREIEDAEIKERKSLRKKRRKIDKRERRTRLKALADASDYYSLTPKEFEQAIAELLRRDGHSRIKVSGGARDLGADVIAYTAVGSKIVVQCKRYHSTRPVGSPEIQKFAGTCRVVHQADLPIFVTTSTFTQAAKLFAKKAGIKLIDEEVLSQWRSGSILPTLRL